MRINGARSDICGPTEGPGDGSVLGVLAAVLGVASARSRRPEERIKIDMRKLDRTRAFGTIKGGYGPYHPDGCDRVAVYEQDGRLFDIDDREVVPGVSLAAMREQRRQANQQRNEAVAELLAHADEISPATLKSMARILLGPTQCPAKKDDIKAALQARLAGAKAAAAAMEDEDEDAGPVRTGRTVPPTGTPAPASSPRHKGLSFESMTAPSQGKSGANVNLAAWGRAGRIQLRPSEEGD